MNSSHARYAQEHRIRVLKTLLEFTKLSPSRLSSYANISSEKSYVLFPKMVEESLIRFEPNTGPRKGPASGWYYITIEGHEYFDKYKGAKYENY